MTEAIVEETVEAPRQEKTDGHEKESWFKPSMTPESLAAFVDGVFAIALTLMVLEIRFPDLPVGGEAALLQGYIQAFQGLNIYASSFFLAACFWGVYHRTITYLRKVDFLTTWLVLPFLLLVALIPFHVAVMVRYYDSFLPVLALALNCWLMCLFWYMLWRHATSGHRLVHPAMPDRLIRMHYTWIVSFAGINLVMVLACLFSPPLARLSALVLGMATIVTIYIFREKLMVV